MSRERSWRLLVLTLSSFFLMSVPTVLAQSSEPVKKEGKLEGSTVNDPALQLMLKKGLISQAEYDEAVQAGEKKRADEESKFKVGYDQGLYLEGPKFGLRIQLRLQFRYTHEDFNGLHATVGDRQFFGSTASPILHSETVDTFHIRRARLLFSGYVFSRDIYYQLQLQHETGEAATAASQTNLFDLFVTFKQLPYANVQIGQYKVFFNRTQILSTGRLQLVERSIVQDAFIANGLNRRDQGITLMSGGAKYPINYYLGIFNGTGINLSNAPAGFRNPNEFMYVARLEGDVLGKPGYLQDDFAYSVTPQFGIAGGYAYNAGLDTVNFATALRSVGNGRLANQGIVDLGTWNAEAVFKYKGFSAQGEYWFRTQDQHGPGTLGNASGWNVQSGYYVIPQMVEVALRYGYYDPDTRLGSDLIREMTAGLTWLFSGHDHKIQMDYSRIQIGTVTTNSQLGEGRFRVQYQFWF